MRPSALVRLFLSTHAGDPATRMSVHSVVACAIALAAQHRDAFTVSDLDLMEICSLRLVERERGSGRICKLPALGPTHCGAVVRRPRKETRGSRDSRTHACRRTGGGGGLPTTRLLQHRGR